jgi:hypothetical protein
MAPSMLFSSLVAAVDNFEQLFLVIEDFKSVKDEISNLQERRIYTLLLAKPMDPVNQSMT